jgi:hypothetical protein
MHGKGRMTFADLSFYDGEWKDGEMMVGRREIEFKFTSI